MSKSLHDWYSFIDKIMLVVGSLFLVFGIIFLVAFNWDDIPRYLKFGLAEGLVTLSVLASILFNSKKLYSDISLLVASFLVGVLLALFGQVYQTGADTWQLFFYWAILIFAWVLVSRFSFMWGLFVILINTSALMYVKNCYFMQGNTVGLIFIAINSVFLVFFEISSYKFKYFKNSWLIRFVGFLSAISFFVLFNKLDFLTFLVWGIWLAYVYYMYRIKQIDLFMMTLFYIVVSIGIINILISLMGHIEFLYIFIIGIVLLVVTAISATWLKSLHKELNNEK